MPHANDDQFGPEGPWSRISSRALFSFYALVLIGTPVLFISYFVKYGA